MKSTLQFKLIDYERWCESAVQHYNNEHYEDALTNMRKCGEVACKLIFLVKYNEKISNDKTINKSYNELIQLVREEKVVPRKVVNWLESIQIHGNIATHDNNINSEQAKYGIAALQLLTNWLFTEWIKIVLPSKIKDSFKNVSIPKKDNHSDELLKKEIEQLKEEKKNLNNELIKTSKETNQDLAKIKLLNEKLNNIELQQKELNYLKNRTIELEEQLQLTKDKTNKEKIEVQKQSRKIIIIITSILLVLVSLWGVYLLGLKKQPKNIEKQNVAEIKSEKMYSVAILPFNIMQDNPNIEIKIEKALENQLQQRMLERDLKIKVLFYEGKNIKNSNQQEALELGKKIKADLVFYGELFEPVNTDSMQVEIKYTLTREDYQTKGDFGVLSFKSLTDSSFVKLRERLETIIDFALAEQHILNKQYSEALSLLYTTKAIDIIEKKSLFNFRAECQVKLGNYEAAIKELEMYIELDNEDAYGYAFMANVLREKGDYKLAEDFYIKSLNFEPNNINTLHNYSFLLGNTQYLNLAKAKKMIRKSIEIDSLNAISWKYAGDIELMLNNINTAKEYYEKSLGLDTNFVATKIVIAQLLAFNFNKEKEAEDMLNEIIKNDSSNYEAIYLLGNIYVSTRLKNPEKADYLFSLSKKGGVGYTQNSLYGKAVALQQNGKLDSAIYYYTEAFKLDSSNLSLSNNLANALIEKKDFSAALKQIKHSYSIDSLDFSSNYMMAYFYYLYYSPYYDVFKAKKYFEKAIKTNPYDEFSIESLIVINNNIGNAKESEELAKKLLKFNPNNFVANKYMGLILRNKEDFKSSLEFYQRAYEINSNDAELLSQMAVLYVQMNYSNIGKSLKLAEKAVKISPQNPQSLYTLAQMYYYSNNMSKSAHYYYLSIEIDPSYKQNDLERELKKYGY